VGLGFGEAKEQERKLMPGLVGEDPGDDDEGEETARLRARVHAGAESGERKERFGFGLALVLPRLVLYKMRCGSHQPSHMAGDDGGVSAPRGEERQVKRGRREMCFGIPDQTTAADMWVSKLPMAWGCGGDVRSAFVGPHVTGTCS
jgi:hypothetical protein